MTDLRTYIGAMSHDDEPEASPQQQLEESFTVNLGWCVNCTPVLSVHSLVTVGSQNKTSHNVRLLCGSVSAFLRTAHGDPQQGKFRLDPHQLQTAMSLYTNNLSALVVMEEARAGTVSSNRDGKPRGQHYRGTSINAHLHTVKCTTFSLLHVYCIVVTKSCSYLSII